MSLINIAVSQEGSNCGNISYTYDVAKKEGSWCYENVEYGYYDEREEYLSHMYDGVDGFNQDGEFEIQNGVLVKYNGKDDNVTVPEGVIGIGVCSFFHQTDVKTVTLPDSVKFIDVGAFRYCGELEKIALPNGIECIGASAFEQCKRLKEIDLPDTIVELGSKCFYGSGLINVKIPKGVSIIKTCLFYDCEKLENVEMHEGITEIQEDAFMGCDHLCEVTVPEGLTELNDSVFWDCQMLQKITLPSTLKSFCAGHVFHSNNLREIIVHKDNKHLKVVKGGLYTYDGKKLIKCLSCDKEFTIEDGTAYVGEYAFSQNKDLEKVNFPKSLKSIGIEAFYGCKSLKEVDLPMGLLTIDYEAFQGCSILEKAYVPSTLKIDLEDCFDMCDDDLKIIKK